MTLLKTEKIVALRARQVDVPRHSDQIELLQNDLVVAGSFDPRLISRCFVLTTHPDVEEAAEVVAGRVHHLEPVYDVLPAKTLHLHFLVVERAISRLGGDLYRLVLASPGAVELKA